jgi:peptidylprolyl isomerase
MPAQNGDTVRVHYTGTLGDGTEFDSSAGREPLAFTVGGGQVIPGFDEAIRGMEAGEQKTVTIPADEAYGHHRSEMVLQVERDALPEGLDPEVGDELALTTPEGQQVPVRVTEVTEEGVVLDANHPLAGEDLTFELTLDGIG